MIVLVRGLPEPGKYLILLTKIQVYARQNFGQSGLNINMLPGVSGGRQQGLLQVFQFLNTVPVCFYALRTALWSWNETTF